MTMPNGQPSHSWEIVTETTVKGICRSPGGDFASPLVGDEGWIVEGMSKDATIPPNEKAGTPKSGSTCEYCNTTCMIVPKGDSSLESRDSNHQSLPSSLGLASHWLKINQDNKDFTLFSTPTASDHTPSYIDHGDSIHRTPALDNRHPTNTFPRNMDDLSHSNLGRLFPHLSSDQIEEWLQKGKTPRDKAYIGEEVKLSIARDYDNFEPHDMNDKQDPPNGGGNRQSEEPEGPAGPENPH